MRFPPKVFLVGGPDVDARLDLMHCLNDDFDLTALGSVQILRDRFRAEGMREYLNMMRLEPHGKSTPKRHLQIFTNAIGDLARLERAWIKHEQQLLRKSRSLATGRNP